MSIIDISKEKDLKGRYVVQLVLDEEKVLAGGETLQGLYDGLANYFRANGVPGIDHVGDGVWASWCDAEPCLRIYMIAKHLKSDPYISKFLDRVTVKQPWGKPWDL